MRFNSGFKGLNIISKGYRSQC